MIIARLQGGLGNQLFQYAAAKALAERLNVSFRLETITSLQKDRKRHIALHDFNTHFELATNSEVRKFILLPTLYRHQPSFFSKLGRHIYREPRFHYDEKFLQLKDPVYLDGFWQSPRYFNKIESIIREDFTVKSAVVKEVIEKGKELQNLLSVAVHIRRGDFLNKKTAAFHGVLEAAWYENAIALITEKIPGIIPYIFSDDTEWVKANLKLDPKSQFVSSFTQSAIEDFYLMTKCRHNIIANSSFSWWSAWLNANPGKTVIAPKRWFANGQINTNDLIPAGWLRL